MAVMVSLLATDRSCGSAAHNDAYAFNYAIDDGDLLLQHWQQRTNDIVRGAYSLLEPSGKIRTVDYQSAGEEGFRAAVNYRSPKEPTLMGHLAYPDYIKNSNA